MKLEGAKYDTGKPKLSRVPPEVITAIATVREFGLPSLWHLATNAAFLCACLADEAGNPFEEEDRNDE